MPTRQADDPFLGVAAEPPDFSFSDAMQMARDNYGLEVSVDALVSERDQNFRLTMRNGQRRVLKIANALEDPRVTDLQISALVHIASRKNSSVVAPEIIRTLDERNHFVAKRNGNTHIVRMVTYLSGRPLTGKTLNPAVCRELGQRLAQLDVALADFSHPGADQTLLWNMQRALQIRDLLPHVTDSASRDLLSRTLDDFEAHALPVFETLRRQVIHNDANPANVLAGKDGQSVAGIIDFGDMLFSPLIVELGVAAAYLRALTGNPLAFIAELLAGYCSVLELTRSEIDVLHDLVKTRLATTVAILAWRESMRDSDDPYLQEAAAAEETALRFLQRLAEIPRSNARQMYAQVCASVNRADSR